jgi:hypothetical protein
METLMTRSNHQIVEHSSLLFCGCSGGWLLRSFTDDGGKVMRLTPEQLRFLTRKECNLWPSCNCYSFLTLWGKLLGDDEKLWELADSEAGEDMIFITLRCVEGHCPAERLP